MKSLQLIILYYCFINNCSTGIVLGFLSNDKISTAIDSYTGTVDAAIQDGVNFVEDTLDVCIEAFIVLLTAWGGGGC